MGSIKQIISTMKNEISVLFKLTLKLNKMQILAAINISEIYGIEIEKGYSPF